MVKHCSALMLLLLASCATSPPGPHLSASEALRIADAEARRQGYDVAKFQRPTPRYNYVERDETWWVHYEPRTHSGLAELGDDFDVTVEDNTKKTWLIPGR